MSKKIPFIIASALLLSSTSAFADTIPNRPANATGTAPGVDAKVHMIQPEKGGVEGINPDTPGYWEIYYTEPTSINVSIYTLDATKAEGAYQTTVSVPFTSYVKDVLPNEWTESWGNTSAGMNSLIAGALAVKTYGWYHVIAWKKDSAHNANVTNGTTSQVYISGSNKTNCNSAVDLASNLVIVNSSDQIVESGYLANVSTPGNIMSQNGTYTDALNGMWYGDIIKKWYKNWGGHHTPEKVFYPYE